jgi:hypothetical protein
MKAESIVFALAGMCFIIRWVLEPGSGTALCQPPLRAPRPRPELNTLDEAGAALTTVLDTRTTPAPPCTANTYFDGARYEDAITW